MPKSRLFLAASLSLLAFCLVSRAAEDERPSAARLLPEKTLAYIRVADTKDTIERFQKTAIGRIIKDEEVAPLLQHLYGSAADAFARIEEEVGLSLEEILKLPQGEISLALVAREEGPPVIVILFEAGEQIASARKLIERGEELVIRRGGSKEVEKFGDLELVTYVDRGGGFRTTKFEQDGVIGLVSDMEVCKDLLSAWDGTYEEKTLSEKDTFTSIMKACETEKESPPQITWFVDPIEILDVAMRDNPAGALVMPFLPVLGLDGLKGLGGSVTLAEEEFDMISHVHVLIEEPRTGLLEAIALEHGDTTPENWVPGDAAGYLTLHWDVKETYQIVTDLVDGFQGNGYLRGQADRNISDRLGVDFEDDLMAALDGRFTWVTWMEKPARLNSQANLIGIKVKDPSQFNGTLKRIVGEFEERFEEKTFAGVKYYLADFPQRGPFNPDRDESAPEFRRPTPCLAIVGDYLMLTDSEMLLKQAISTKSDASKSLANSIEYKLIAGKIERQAGEVRPSMVTFNRPEQGMRLIYDLAADDGNRDRLAGAQSNPLFKALGDALDQNPLPPFSRIARYLAPGGGVLTSDETGIHYVGFSLHRE